jgi:predicted RNase H-like HicB family nuclease
VKIQLVIHPAEEGGYWAEVPALPGCASQGDTMEELMANIREAIDAYLSVPPNWSEVTADDQVLELEL